MRHYGRGVLGALIALTTVTGCATGQRPRLADTDIFSSGPPTGDPAIDAVLAMIEHAPEAPLVATYRIERRIGGVRTDAEVQVDAGGRRVRIGTVTFIITSAGAQTCVAAPSGDECSPGLNQARISDTGVTMAFFNSDAAKRLRRDSVSKIGAGAASTKSIAGQQATCVDVPFGENSATYCAVPAGLIAQVVEGDVLIDLVELKPGLPGS